jgi:hypothetical protein
MSVLSQDIRALVALRPIPVADILAKIACAAKAADDDSIAIVVDIGEMHGLYDEVLAIPATCALPAWGEQALAELVNIVRHGHYGDIALRVLLHLALRIAPPSKIDDGWSSQLQYEPSMLADSAWRKLRELILDQATDRDLRRRLTQVMSLALNKPDENEAQDLFWQLFTESPLSLNQQILGRFKALLDSGTSEEELQQFLEEHPVLLDATAIEVIAKHRLGTEYVTDFVVRQINGDYILVEIEKSTDRLFTVKGRVHHELTDAMAQVREFQRWIHENIAYARTLLPGIARPHGLVVVGRSKELTPDLRKILDEENFSRRGYIEVLTYDDLVERALAIHSNLTAPRRARSMRDT